MFLSDEDAYRQHTNLFIFIFVSLRMDGLCMLVQIVVTISRKIGKPARRIPFALYFQFYFDSYSESTLTQHI